MTDTATTTDPTEITIDVCSDCGSKYPGDVTVPGAPWVVCDECGRAWAPVSESLSMAWWVVKEDDLPWRIWGIADGNRKGAGELFDTRTEALVRLAETLEGARVRTQGEQK